ncbi:hypothetical protein Dimus_012729 [Dionaea muscipula]
MGCGLLVVVQLPSISSVSMCPSAAFHMALEMDSVQRSAVTPSKSRLARTFAKVVHLRAATGVAPIDGGFQKAKSEEDMKEYSGKRPDIFKVELVNGNHDRKSFEKIKEERYRRINVASLEAVLAQLFASVSCIKAAYAELQLAQFPYDADGIQASDQLVVDELKLLSELKQCYLKKQYLDCCSPGKKTTLLALAEIKEQKSVAKGYEIMGKKLESELRLKESEITFLAEKLEESKRDSRLLEKRLRLNSNSSGGSGGQYPLSMLDNDDNNNLLLLHHLSGLNPSHHFFPLLGHTVRTIRSFVKVVINETRSAGWNLDLAVNTIQPGVEYWKPEHKCFAFESFVCREMFDSFHHPNFSLPVPGHKNKNKNRNRQMLFFKRFNELKSSRSVKEYLSHKPKSKFGKFCRAKYLRIVHPKMESSFFGNLDQRNLINSGDDFPETAFFTAFLEMAKRVWLLHCIAFSFDPAASIFQVKRGCRFSQVYMESLVDEPFLQSNDHNNHDRLEENEQPSVTFTVVPGFIIGKTVIQCQVYLSRSTID